MIQVTPQISGIPTVTHCGAVYAPARVVLTGMRWLVEYRAGTTPSAPVLWGDLPTSHGLYAQVVFDPVTKRAFGQDQLQWWVEPLERMFRHQPVTSSIVKVDCRKKADRLIFLNTVDSIFGHSLFLLLSAQHYLAHHPDWGLVVIITPHLRPHLPKGIAEVWELNTGLAETALWHQSLADLFETRSRKCPSWIATVPTVPSPSRYRLETFNLAPAQEPPNLRSPRIVFLYRGDRFWGGSSHGERARLRRLGNLLSSLWPQVRLEIHGHARLPTPVDGWTDCTRRAEPDYDARLLVALRQADLVMGAHGSNQLFPTAVAKLVLELVPLEKQRLFLSDCLIDVNRWSVQEQFWRLRFLYGNWSMTDIYPRQVAQLINSMISLHPHFVLYHAPTHTDPDGPPWSPARLHAETITPAVRAYYERLHKLWALSWRERFWQWLRRWSGERE